MANGFGQRDLSGVQRFGDLARQYLDRSFQRKIATHNLMMDATRRTHAKRVSLGYAQSVQNATTAEEVVQAASLAQGSLAGLGEYGDRAIQAIQKDADMRLKVLAPDKNITAGDIAKSRAMEDVRSGRIPRTQLDEYAQRYFTEMTRTGGGPKTGEATVMRNGKPTVVYYEIPTNPTDPPRIVEIGEAQPTASAGEAEKNLRELAEAAARAKGEFKGFAKGYTEERLSEGRKILSRLLSPAEQQRVIDEGERVEDVAPDLYERLAKEKMDVTARDILNEIVAYNRAERKWLGYDEALKSLGYALDEETSKLIERSDITPAPKEPPPPLSPEGQPRQVDREKTKSGEKKVGRFILK